MQHLHLCFSSCILFQAVEILAALKRLGEDLSAEEQVLLACSVTTKYDPFYSIFPHLTRSCSIFLNQMRLHRLPLSLLLQMLWMKSPSRCFARVRSLSRIELLTRWCSHRLLLLLKFEMLPSHEPYPAMLCPSASITIRSCVLRFTRSSQNNFACKKCMLLKINCCRHYIKF